MADRESPKLFMPGINQSAEIIYGEMTGVKVGVVHGGLMVASPHAEPPSLDFLAHYLEQLAAGTPPPDDASAELRRLWAQPFCARGPDFAGIDLCETVRNHFAQDRQVDRIQRVVILADAGGGKTPALYYLRTCAAKNSLKNYRAHKTRKEKSETAELNREVFVIPIFLHLADMRTGLPTAALIRDAINASISPEADVDEITADQVPHLLKDFRCLFLLDDLDELFSVHQRGGIQAISQFMETHPRQQFVVSCRKPSYRGQLGAVDLLYLDDLTSEQVQDVLTEERYGTLNPFLRKALQNRAALNDLLDLLKEGSSAELVVSRGQLLQRRICKSLGRDRTQEPGDRAYLDMVKGVLECLAYSMQRDHTYTYGERRIMEVMQQYLQDWHEPHTWREVASYACHEGMLQQDEMRRWRFCDRSTQAYFAAAAILQEQTALQPVLDEVSDYWWRDLLQVLIGLVSEPEDLLFELIERDALVAANCIQFVGRDPDDLVVDALIDALVERMSRESSARRAFIVGRIMESRHPRAAEVLLLALYREWSSVVIMAITEALLAWDKEHPDLPIAEEEKKIQHGAPEEAISVSELLRMCDQDVPEHGQDRLVGVLEDPQAPPRIRGLAAICLGLLEKDVACGALLDVLLDPQPDDFVAWCTVESLTRMKHPDVQDAALRLYQGEEFQTEGWARHRARAVYLLGWVGEGRKVGETLSNALQDPSPIVRGFVVNAIARLDLRHAREMIEGLMANETEAQVLRKAAEALAQIGTVESIAVLERHLRHPQARIRWMVRRAIAEIRERHQL
jgi:HEAT repeat protein